ncbi:MAG TPA: competence/damage-inducible protein A [Gemmatimonadales bacterium]|nr:competence/damage-inducible protein A [Gemmatimonadales bacterium]
MAIELLTIGTELLLGFTVDSNAAEIGRALSGAGIRVTRKASVGDTGDAILAGVQEALGRTGAVLCTGGLGPTADDITKKVVADLYGWPLEFHDAIWQHLLERFARFGRKPAEKNRSQAEVPRGAVVLPNRWGTAPGLWFEGPPGLVILLPGVPSEMRGLLHHEVLPRLASRAGNTVIRSRALRTTGVPESTLAERITGIEEIVAPLSLAYLPGVMGVDLRLTAWNLPADEADQRLARGIGEIRARAAEWIYGEDDADLAAVVLDQARRRGWKIATAESCTGGGLGERLTNIPGSSDVFLGGVVAYDNAVKEGLLDVPPALFAEHGAVSEPVAAAMVRGITRRLRAELGISVTGIAGPGGGTPDKPVGLVYIGTAVKGTVTVTRSLFVGDRGEIRARAAQVALNRLRLAVEMGAGPAT